MPSSTKEKKLLVFLSYAREDKAIVEKLYKRLKADGFAPWMDEKDLLPGQDWPSEIDRAMRRSHVILLCFSNKSISKEGYIQREYKKAMDLQQEKPPGTIFVIPVRLDDCPIPSFSGNLQCVDFPRNYKKLVLSLHERAKMILPEEPEEPETIRGSAEDGTRTAGGTGEVIIVPGSGDTVVQIIVRIFNKDELDRLVRASIKKPGELQEIWAQTFPAGGAKPMPRSGGATSQDIYQEFTAEFLRNNEIARLMGEIKKRNVIEYRKFLTNQVLNAIGLSAKNIPVVTSNTKVVEKELLKLQRTAISQQNAIHNDNLEFEDRIDLLDEIHDNGDFSHIVLHGPSGVGKTFFLNHFPSYVQDRFNRDTRSVLIDLDSCTPTDILGMAIRQLGGEAKSKNNYLELATLIRKLFSGEPTINRFYFLFDNADKNQAAIDYLFGPDNIIDHPILKRILKDWGLLGKIQLKIVMAARHPVMPSKIHPPFSSAQQQKMMPLRKPSVQHMLEKLMKERHIPPHLDLVRELTDEVYYLTGGHPKCTKQMLLALAERGCVKQTEEEWEELYREHVFPTIHAEMLLPFDSELLSIIWNLSIFRRFDQRLLWGLLDRGILPDLSGDKSLQALDLGARLVKINLFDTESKTSTISTNYVMRHALSLNMQLDALERYKSLHSIALEIYLERFLGSEPAAEKQMERLAINLFELLYHWTKLLEVEVWKKESKSRAKPICARIRDAFANYFQMALTMVQAENHPAFYQSLRKRWEEDKELQEAIRRITPHDDCQQKLLDVLQESDKLQNRVE